MSEEEKAGIVEEIMDSASKQYASSQRPCCDEIFSR
jgi:hypothetical protein